MTIAGIVTGYIFCTASAIKAELTQAANAKVLQRIEEARSAPWSQFVPANFPDQVITLDLPGTDPNATSATLHTTIAQIPLSQAWTIHVDCIWQFRDRGSVTNSMETIRAANL